MRFSLNRKPEAAEEQPRPQIPVVYADPARGLSESEVTERFAAGYDNRDIAPPTKTVKEIILSNVFTYLILSFSSSRPASYWSAHGITSHSWASCSRTCS